MKRFSEVATSENLFSRARKRTCSIIEFAKTYDIVFIRFLSKRYVYVSSANVRTNSRKERCDFEQCSEIASVSHKQKTLRHFLSSDFSDGDILAEFFIISPFVLYFYGWNLIGLFDPNDSCRSCTK